MLRWLGRTTMSGGAAGSSRVCVLDFIAFFMAITTRVLLQVEVLEEMGEPAAAAELFDKHYRGSIGVCGEYVEMLIRQGDLAKARDVLEDARGIFPRHELEYISRLADGAAG